MPSLENHRHEMFAQNLARGMPQSEAYAAAGFKSEGAHAISCNASRLGADPDVVRRVAELQERAAQRAVYKVQDVIEMLASDRTMARDKGQLSAAIRAAELIGKQIGMFVERKEIKTGQLDDLDPEQLDAITAAAVAEAARRIAGGSGDGETDAENPDLLPGARPAAAGALPEAS